MFIYSEFKGYERIPVLLHLLTHPLVAAEGQNILSKVWWAEESTRLFTISAAE